MDRHGGPQPTELIPGAPTAVPGHHLPTRTVGRWSLHQHRARVFPEAMRPGIPTQDPATVRRDVVAGLAAAVDVPVLPAPAPPLLTHRRHRRRRARRPVQELGNPFLATDLQ
jgi:hypothetical protein